MTIPAVIGKTKATIGSAGCNDMKSRHTIKRGTLAAALSTALFVLLPGLSSAQSLTGQSMEECKESTPAIAPTEPMVMMPEAKMQEPMPIPMAKAGTAKADMPMKGAVHDACVDKMLKIDEQIMDSKKKN